MDSLPARPKAKDQVHHASAASISSASSSSSTTSSTSHPNPPLRATMERPSVITLDNLPSLLTHDTKVKVAGIDIDGQLRGKLMSKSKFLSVASSGFGFCSVVFGMDMHDTTYGRELKISNAASGYRDMLAKLDLQSYRRVPWEDDVPFFLLSFWDGIEEDKEICACPRNLLRKQIKKAETVAAKVMAGAEYEIYQYKLPPTHTAGVAQFLQHNQPLALPHLTEGNFGYSLTRPVMNKDYFYGIYDACEKFDCGIEGWHTEIGPAVFEAALSFDEVASMADKAALFKYTVKSVGVQHGVTPCFMAKPQQGIPGNSGHMHISLVDSAGSNLFARTTPDPSPPYADLTHFSDLARHFLAGVLTGLPDVMPLFAPTINSYKRLVENFWAPVTVSWGLEHRAASIRLIAPPMGSAKATRLEVRVPGADAVPHLALAAILGCGLRGVEKKLEIPIPPLGMGEDVGGQADKGERLAKDLKEATRRMGREGSVAREVFGDEFVEHYVGTREHECRVWEEAVTDWEFKRYIETV